MLSGIFETPASLGRLVPSILLQVIWGVWSKTPNIAGHSIPTLSPFALP